MPWCVQFGVLLLNFIFLNANQEPFTVEYQWRYINYTWRSPEEYEHAISNQRYIPQNNVMAGIKFSKDKLFIALPRIREGTPVTLAYIPLDASQKSDQLLSPFPNWEMNVKSNCSSLQSVQSMEIDGNNVMWVLDGNRFNGLTKCPPKIVLLDLNNNGEVLEIFDVPHEICPNEACFLNDLVVDETDGGYAFITEAGVQDPGLIVFSRAQKKTWKLRDRSMFAEIEAAGFSVDGVASRNLISIDGITIDPSTKEERFVYYCALTGYNLYAISTKILKNYALSKSSNWRKEVIHIGRKQGVSDGLAMDNKGNLYYGLLDLYAVGKWNVFESFQKNATLVFEDRNTVIWPDSFGFDLEGNIYVLANQIHKVFDAELSQSISDKVKFRILKYHTGTKNYFYPLSN